MRRRGILAGSALLLGFAGSAAAQSSRRAVHAPAGMAEAPAVVEAARQALLAGLLSLATSEVAAGRAENTLLRVFADFEVAEQRATLQALRLAGQAVPEQPEPAGDYAAIIQALQAASSEFDRLYLRIQLAIHHDLLQLHGQLRMAGGREQRIISTLSAVTAEQHLRILQSLQARQA